LAPLPPKPVEKELEVRVSPGPGTRGVRVMKSMLREPITAMEGEGMLLVFLVFGFGVDVFLFFLGFGLSFHFSSFESSKVSF
jgi:hypothetical protein